MKNKNAVIHEIKGKLNFIVLIMIYMMINYRLITSFKPDGCKLEYFRKIGKIENFNTNLYITGLFILYNFIFSMKISGFII